MKPQPLPKLQPPPPPPPPKGTRVCSPEDDDSPKARLLRILWAAKVKRAKK